MKKALPIIIVIAIILIIAAGLVCYKLGFTTGETAGKKSMESTVAQYKEIIDYSSPIPEEEFGVFGKITKIQDRVISIETIVQDPYVLPDKWETKIIKVTIADETKITTFDEDAMEFVEIAFSELKVGDEISANAEENIKDKIEFTAASIELIAVPEMIEE